MNKIKTDPVYTIGVAAKLLGVSVHLLRVYEKEGLILSERTSTGRRMYSDLEIEKVRCIRRMIKEQGINYEGLRRMLALVPCWRLRGCENHEKELVPLSKIRIAPAGPQKKNVPIPLIIVATVLFTRPRSIATR